MSAVHQFVPTLEPGAVGHHVVMVRELLHELGVESTTFAEHVKAGMAGVDFREYGRSVPARPDDVLLYHVAIGSTVADFVRDRAPRLVLDHHNITPATYWAGWEPAVVPAAAWARNQFAELAPRAELGIAHSRYSERELTALRCRRTAVVPVLVDLAGYDRAVDEEALAGLRHDGPVWLFVGRLAPNKAQQDLVKAFAVFRRVYAPDAVLRLVGGSSSERYLDALRSLVTALDLDDAVDITGSVPDGVLAAHYRSADVLVCVSEHEGFCVPLLEAMHHGVPIVAYDSTAVGETVGAGGLLLPGKSPGLVAAAVDRVVADEGLRTGLVEAGRRRLAELAPDVTRRRYREALEAVLR
jgi:glycosyltransferase involved in cell wall biosynthesis